MSVSIEALILLVSKESTAKHKSSTFPRLWVGTSICDTKFSPARPSQRMKFSASGDGAPGIDGC